MKNENTEKKNENVLDLINSVGKYKKGFFLCFEKAKYTE